MPFNNVFERIFDITSVKNIPNIITNITTNVESNEAPNPFIVPATKIVEIVIKKGNLPITWNKIIS